MTGDDDLKINAVIIPKDKFNFCKMFSPESNKGYLLTAYLSFAVVSGIIVYSVLKNQITAEYAEIFEKFIVGTTSKNEINLFLSLLRNTLPYILIVCLLSVSVLGDILIYLVSFIKFAGYGAFTTFLYTQYGISGIKYLFYIFIPGRIIFIIALLFLIDVSVKISRQIRAKNRLPSHENRSLVIRLGFMLVLVLLSLIIDLFTIKSLLTSTGINSLF